MRYGFLMRTTIDIDIDILQGAKEEAKYAGTTAGRVISMWARTGRTRSLSNGTRIEGVTYVHGVPQFPSRGRIVSMEQIQKIMDEEGI